MDLLSSPVVQTAIVSLCAALAAALVAYARKAWYTARKDHPDLYVVEYLAALAVKAAEQMAKSGQLDLAGRKAYALKALADALKGAGISLDVAALEAAIEAAVWSELNNPPQ